MGVKIRYLLFIFAFGILIFSGDAIAASVVGISPGDIYFKNVLRGGYAERYITVTLSENQEVNIQMEARGEIIDWLNFISNFSVSRDKPQRILISISPPSDTPNGNYSGFIRVHTDHLGDVAAAGGASSIVRAVIDISISVEIVDFEIKACKARNFNIFSAEKGDEIIFEMNVLNDGNIRLRPEVVLNIWDKEQIGIVKKVEVKGAEILPTKEERLKFNLSSFDFDLDQYWATIDVPECFSNSGTLTFDVLEPGTLRAEGVLLRIFSKVWAEVDETIPITVEFKNTGEKIIDAQFRGQITHNGKVIQVLESDKREVQILDIANFTFFLTPKKIGRYIASGRVYYDKKLTYESSTVINVKSRKIGIKEILLMMVYFSLALFIGVLIYKIRKEKRRYKARINRLREHEK